MAKRAPRGAESRTEIVTVRLTRSERVRLEQRASAAGLTVSAFAAQVLAKGQVTVEASPAPHTIAPALLAEFKRIGNNVNQIAHALHARGLVPQHGVAHAFNDFMRALLKDEVLKARAAPAADAYLASRKNPS